MLTGSLMISLLWLINSNVAAENPEQKKNWAADIANKNTDPSAKKDVATSADASVEINKISKNRNKSIQFAFI